MDSRFDIKQIGGFLVIGILLIASLYLAGHTARQSIARGVDIALVDDMNPGMKWEYKSILLAPGADQALNTEVSEFGWEFLGATGGYALFRRGVTSEQ